MSEPTVTIGVEKARDIVNALNNLAYALKTDPLWRYIREQAENLARELAGQADLADPEPTVEGEQPHSVGRGRLYAPTWLDAEAAMRRIFRKYPRNPYGTSVRIHEAGGRWAIDWYVGTAD